MTILIGDVVDVLAETRLATFAIEVLKALGHETYTYIVPPNII